MTKRRIIQTIDTFPDIALLREKYHVKLKASGNSMYPFLRNNTDTIELKPVTFDEISKGDIVLIQNEKRRYIIHRVYKKYDHSFFILGDAGKRPEGPFFADNLIGVVCNIWRGDKQINIHGFPWKFLVKIWMFLIPLRPSILKTKRYIFSLSNKTSQS